MVVCGAFVFSEIVPLRTVKFGEHEEYCGKCHVPLIEHLTYRLAYAYTGLMKTVTLTDRQVSYLESESSLIHDACGTILPNREALMAISGENAYCHKCDEMSCDISFGISKNHSHFDKDLSLITMDTWYHATNVKDWEKKVRDSNQPVHLGTKTAAYDRILGMGNNPFYDEPETFYLHEIRFKPCVEVHSIVNDDDANSLQKNQDKVVHPYINSWEDAGNLSLVARPDCFEIVSTEKHEVENVKESYDSLYTVVDCRDNIAYRRSHFKTIEEWYEGD